MRDTNRVVYTSSYDRGLQHLLEMWSSVIQECPKATLHIYYGWQLFEKFYANNPSSMAWMKKMQEMMTYAGITHHGRIPQEKVKEEMLKSGIWAYPTHFGEINCISAIKAQAYGCEPVVVNYAALKETVQFGRKIEGDIYDFETKDEFKKQLIDALKNPMSKEKREAMMAWTKEKYSWKKISEQWSEEFRR